MIRHPSPLFGHVDDQLSRLGIRVDRRSDYGARKFGQRRIVDADRVAGHDGHLTEGGPPFLDISQYGCELGREFGQVDA